MCSVMGAGAVVFATRTLVPITTFANLHGEAARIAAVESMHKLMRDYINRQSDEPVRH